MRVTVFFILLTVALLQKANCQPAQRFDVLITEIMADPTPQVLLPNAEFVELKNMSGRTLNLSGWRLVTSTSQSGLFPVYNLPADSFLIVSSSSNAGSFAAYGKFLGVTSFPSLDNDGSTLSFISKEGVVEHAVPYLKSWYHNDVKSEGGWTLEMIDTKNPCTGSNNWKASVSPLGGTPGKINSVDGINKDESPPQLLRSFSTDSVTIIVVFDEPLDSLTASVVANYQCDGLSIISAKPVAPLFQHVQLKILSSLKRQQVYTLVVSNLKDCRGNVIAVYNKVKCGLSEEVLVKDVIVNEILFNPPANGDDYAEIFNRSKKIVNLSKLYLANRSSSGAIANLKKLSESDFFFYPGEYMVFTSDVDALSRNYFLKDPAAVISLGTMPSFPDDEGNVVLVNLPGDIIDEVHYSDKWHFPLIVNTEGVSLERIDPGDSSGSKNNWHSAASTAGYGTPGYQNSQYKITGDVYAAVQTDPHVFSPDNDGYNDFEVISYNMGQHGFMANIVIYNSAGFVVRKLVNNGLMGIKGNWNWDGLGDKGQALPRGAYIIYTEIFNLDGKVKKFKNVVVLARR
jgi:hypothetical protein